MTEQFYIVTAEGVVSAPPWGKCVIALGTFDGVHVAHKAIFREALALKKRLGASLVGAWCFSELPVNILGNKKMPMLCTLDEKIARILDTGVDFVAIGNFREISSVSAEDFADKILADKLNCVGAVCGFNHRFGHRGLGSHALLKERFGEDSVAVVPEITMFGETVSSSAIREHILSGELEIAQAMLDQPICMSSPVVSGKHLGHSLGFPTANQSFPKGIITPKHGIYATLCYTEDGKRHIGVSNVGVRPTITDGSDLHGVNCETYICNFNGDIYGQALKVEFCAYLREERKFASVEELREQIAIDEKNALKYFEASGII